jgi:integrase
LHGLRKTLGKRIAESGGTTRQAMAALGHDTIGESERYSREAEREDLARQAMNKVVAFVGRRRG